MRLIDADILPRHGSRGGLVRWQDIEDAPTVDAIDVVKQMFSGEMKLMPAEDAPTVDIVRCKECGLWWRTTGSNYGDCSHFGLDTIETAYCSYGEREGE